MAAFANARNGFNSLLNPRARIPLRVAAVVAPVITERSPHQRRRSRPRPPTPRVPHRRRRRRRNGRRRAE